MILTVSVTEKDISGGTPRPSTCPVALAANRALKEAGFVGHHAEWEPYRMFGDPEGFVVWRQSNGGEEQVCAVSVGDVCAEAYDFASEFDDWREKREHEGEEDEDGYLWERPAPFSFTVEVPL